MNQNVRSHLIALAATAALACGSIAQAAPQTTVPGHPRVNEVSHRIDNQQKRIDQGVANGTIKPAQAARDQTREANLAQRESADEAKHNGHLTKREDQRLNHAEKRDSHRIHRQRRH